MMIDPIVTDDADGIELAIIEIARTLPKRKLVENWGTNRMPWSDALFCELGKFGEDHGFFVCSKFYKARRADRGHGEWLFDHVWLTNDEDGHITDVPLILECEWDCNNELGVDHDFGKLLLGRAEHRVMIFYSSEVERQFERLIGQVRKCARTQAGDRYLLLGLDRETQIFMPLVFVA
jgi:hypothetical protein